MEKQNDFYEVNEKGERGEFTIYYIGDLVLHKETVKFHLEERKFVFTGTCLRACSTAIAIMGKHYQKVIKAIEEEKEYCDEVNVYWIISDEEIERLGDFVKTLKHERCTMSFDYLSRLEPEEYEE